MNAIQQPDVRPKEVKIAITLLYLQIGIQFLDLMMWIGTKPAGVVICNKFISLGIEVLFIVMMGRGKNWARITFLVLCTLGATSFVPYLIRTFSLNPVSDSLKLFQSVLQWIALIFLFRQKASDWFKKPY